MLTEFLLATFYLAVALFVLLRISRRYKNQLSGGQIYCFFLLKVLFGIAYGIIFLRFYGGDDTWMHHQISLEQYQLLLHHPLQFFTRFGQVNGQAGLQSFFEVDNSFWDNLEAALYVRFLAVLNLFSFGHYYVNVVLFNLLVFGGHLLLFRLLMRYFPSGKTMFILVIFCFPVVLFWLSGLRKDGLLFLALVVTLYYFNELLTRPFRIKAVVLFLLGCSGMLLLRNYMLLCLIPALFAWWACYRFRLPAFICFAVAYGLAAGAFFASGKINGFPDLPEKLVLRQQSFFELKGNTRLPMDSLQPAPASFLKLLPAALNHTFLRPYLTEAYSPLHLAAALDNLLFLLAVSAAFLFPAGRWSRLFREPLLLACLFLGCCGYLLVGYVVPFPGAITRYKVCFELLLLCVFAAMTRLPESKKRIA